MMMIRTMTTITKTMRTRTIMTTPTITTTIGSGRRSQQQVLRGYSTTTASTASTAACTTAGPLHRSYHDLPRYASVPPQPQKRQYSTNNPTRSFISSIRRRSTRGHSSFSSSSPSLHRLYSSTTSSSSAADTTSTTVPIVFVDPNGEETLVQADVGKHLLDIAHDNQIELEGACGGELACATCHLIFEQDVYDTLLPPKQEEEDDMLDLAFSLSPTSRLGCQICVKPEMANMRVQIPNDGFN